MVGDSVVAAVVSDLLVVPLEAVALVATLVLSTPPSIPLTLDAVGLLLETLAGESVPNPTDHSKPKKKKICLDSGNLFFKAFFFKTKESKCFKLFFQTNKNAVTQGLDILSLFYSVPSVRS
jgi:hypothetical protein